MTAAADNRRLADLLASLPSTRILVIGDLILDRYADGKASRVSPEAPVLVFDFENERYLLGGACNVAANLRELGAAASVLGVVGDDEAGRRLRALLHAADIDTQALVVDSTRPTTRKTRYVAKTLQVLRVDEESRAPVGGEAERQLLALLEQRPFPWRSVLLSDYGKGVLTPRVIQAAIAAARSEGGVTVVDPKGKDYSIYRGVDLLTPNREEAEAATGVAIHDSQSLHRAAQRLRELTGVQNAVITLGKDGIFFEAEDGSHRIIPTEARQVFDVTGAGDTVVAVLTYCRATGVSLADSLRLANHAAGITVAKLGTWAPSRREILDRLGETSTPGDSKLLSHDQAIEVASRLRAEGRRLVFTNGCFDILHAGHCDYLQRARSYGDALMVAVNTDASVQRQAKGPGRPFNSLADRMAVLAALQAVDHVVAFDADTPKDLIEALTPQVLAKGEDWRDKGVVGREWVEAHGGQVVLVPLVAGRSTTNVVQRILQSGQ
ncbi:MAG: D-glycero-beta-D-manno-heptose-7-phosphate kinase [Planctomycetes bacterium]|nr:D-glycero-beta-D-manno-heptose-7-phosphate kinase [Planctomycetota bacterium]MCC7395586.1 D-glycero-beta-D-manno-heptose-7-phosphate kinase [Planctomycetota bacterium]